MKKAKIRAIQEMLAPVFGCKPDDLEVGDGYAKLKNSPKCDVTFEWDTVVGLPMDQRK